MAHVLDDRFGHHMANLESGRLHYVMGGEGDPVVLLHGWGSTWYMWRKVMPALADHHTVIAVDLPDLGDSGLPVKRLTGYDKKTVAQDIHELVEHLDLGPINLVGHDHGAAVSYAYCAQFGEEVSRLAFVEMALMGVGVGVEEYMNHGERLNQWHLSFSAASEIAEMLIRGKEREYLTWFYKMQIYNSAGITDEDIDVYVRSYSQPGGLKLEYYRAFYQDGEDNKEFSKKKLTMPVLAVGGKYHIGELAIRTMQTVAENVEGHLIDRCGHWVPEERPEILSDLLLKFFSEGAVEPSHDLSLVTRVA